MALAPELTEFTTASQSVATYSYTEIAEGTGIQSFYGYSSEDSTGLDYHLGANPLYSTLIEAAPIFIAGTTNTKYIDIDFDLSPFNIPKTISGTGILQFTGSLTDVTGGGTITEYFVVRIKKNDVTIVTIQSQDIAAATAGQEILLLPVTIPQTQFQVGDILRITVEGWAVSSDLVTSGRITFGIDPMNRDGDKITPSTEDVITIFKALIPFKLDL